MKKTDFKQKTDQELGTALTDSRQQLAQAVVNMRTKQVKNVKEIAAHKKAIARILTIQRQRQQEKEASNG